MAKAHKAIYYATSFGDSNGNLVNAQIQALAEGGVWGHTQLWAYNSGHPTAADLTSNTAVSRASAGSGGAHGFETFWRLLMAVDGPTRGKVLNAPWENASAWSAANTAQAARMTEMSTLGGNGIWWDPELFATPNPEGLWSYHNLDMWSSGGYSSTRRDLVRDRGEALGVAMSAAFPGSRVMLYPSFGYIPKMLDEYTYGAGYGGASDYSAATESTFWPFLLGFIKGFCTGANAGKFDYTDPFHYIARSATRAANQMLYGNSAFFAALSRGLAGAYDATTAGAALRKCNYLPFLFIDGDVADGGIYVAYTEAQVDTMYGAARDHSCDERFAVFFHAPSGAWNYDGAEWLLRKDNLAAIDVAGASADPAPTISVTSAPPYTGTVTGTAWGRRGIRMVYHTSDGGVTRRAATLVVKNLANNLEIGPATTSLDGSALSLGVDWTITGVPSGGQFVAEDVHGATATFGDPTGGLRIPVGIAFSIGGPPSVRVGALRIPVGVRFRQGGSAGASTPIVPRMHGTEHRRARLPR